MVSCEGWPNTKKRSRVWKLQKCKLLFITLPHGGQGNNSRNTDEAPINRQESVKESLSMYEKRL